MQRSTLRIDLLMLVVAILWGSVFIAQRWGMDHIGPFLYTGLRFVFGSLALLPLVLLQKQRSAEKPTAAFNRHLLKGGLDMGLALTAAINLQQVGLLFTSVTNAGFITGLYVIIVPILGVFLGHRIGSGIWIGASLAVIGMFLLSVGDSFQVASGDWLQLGGAFSWGIHVLLVAHFAARHDPLQLALVQFVFCALFSLLLAFVLEPIALASIVAALPALLYGGVIGVGLANTLQVVTQRSAIPSHAAIIFSLEAVFAAMFGAWLLGESLSLKAYLGCALMLTGMLLAQLWRRQPDVQ